MTEMGWEVKAKETDRAREKEREMREGLFRYPETTDMRDRATEGERENESKGER